MVCPHATEWSSALKRKGGLLSAARTQTVSVPRMSGIVRCLSRSFLGFFSGHRVFHIHPCCSRGQSPLPVEGCRLLRRVGLHTTLCVRSATYGSVDCACLLPAVNLGVQISLRDPTFRSLGHTSLSWIARSRGTSSFRCL